MNKVTRPSQNKSKRSPQYTGFLDDSNFPFPSDNGFRIYQDICEVKELAYHNHDHLEIMLIVSGNPSMYTETHEYPIKPGDVIICTKEMAHGFRNMRGVKHWVLGFLPERYIDAHEDLCHSASFNALFVIEPSLRNKYELLHNLTLEHKSFEKLETLFFQAKEEFLQKKTAYLSHIKSYLQQIIIFLCREFEKKHPHSFSKTNMSPLAYSVEYIHEHYDEKINLEDLAKKLGVSNEYFIKLFKSVYKKTPIDFLIDLRVEKATLDLLNSDESIIKIALSHGFNDSNYFSRIFQKKTGIRPSQYRKLRRQNL